MERWKLFCFHVLAGFVFLATYTSIEANAAVRGFARVTYPNGVAVNTNGEVYVHSLSMLGDGGLYKFSADGTLMGRNPYLFGEIRMVLDEVNGILWGVETRGVLYAINPQTLQAQEFLNPRNLAARPVLNMLSGGMPLLYMINPQFGDIALRRIDQSRFDLFIAGQNATGGIPFVVRLRFDPVLQTDIVVASFPYPNPIIPAPLDSQPSGIAVNGEGTVLTTFPKDVVNGRSPIYLSAFHADFPETGAGVPDFAPAFEHAQVYSMGMTDAPDDGFYFVTTAQGLGCGLGPALVHVSSSLNGGSCLADFSALGMGVMNPDDVAVEPGKRFVYVTMRQNNLVLQVDVPYVPPPVSPSVLFTEPAPGATEVAADSPVTATFSSEMDESTINSATFTLSSGSGHVPGSVNYDAVSNKASFTPASNLSGSTTYTATVSASVASASGSTMTAPRTWSFTTAAEQRSLTTSIIGIGSLNSIPSGIACTTGNAGICRKLFADGVDVTLIPTEGSDSIFGSWSGCTTSSSASCIVAMTAAKAITATFVNTPAVRIAGGAGYSTVVEAYNSAAARSTIQLRSTTLPDHLLLLDKTKQITLKGGYDKRYSSNANSRTTLDGVFLVRAGAVTVEKLAVR